MEMALRDSAHHGKLVKLRGAPGDGIASPRVDPKFKIFYDAGTLILICVARSNDFVAADCWLAAEHLMLAAGAEGLGPCCIGFARCRCSTPTRCARSLASATTFTSSLRSSPAPCADKSCRRRGGQRSSRGAARRMKAL